MVGIATKDFTPWPFQKYVFDKLMSTPNCGVFLGCGMGKTVVALSALDILIKRGEVKRVLIVAPKKVAQATWQREAEKYTHLTHINFQLIEGTPAQRKKQLASTDTSFFIVGRDLFHWVVDQYPKGDWPFDALVLDESSSFKSHSSRRFKKAKLVRPYCDRIILLTGTPAPQSYEDLFSQIFLLDGGVRLRPTITGFRSEFMRATRPVKHGSAIMKYELIPGAKERIDELISDITVCLKTEDYVKLPDVLWETYPVVLDKKAQEAYNKMEDDMVLEFAQTTEEKSEAEKLYRIALAELERHTLCGGDRVAALYDVEEAKEALTAKKKVFAAEQASVNMKLRQICNGWVYDRDGVARHVHDCKKEWLAETLESLLYEGRRCLVAYAFKFDIDEIKAAVPTGYSFRELKTAQDEKDWNDGKIDVLVAHPASCAYGLNLQYGGSEIIWYGLTDNLELYEQFNARLPRNGATRPVTIHIPLVKGSRDEDLYSLLNTKANVQNGLKTSLQEKIKALEGGRLL